MKDLFQDEASEEYGVSSGRSRVARSEQETMTIREAAGAGATREDRTTHEL
jgi:hypothetical protein